MAAGNGTLGQGQKRGSILPKGSFLPILLIVIGLALFSLNRGWLGWESLLGLASLWPLALVAVGVDILTKGSYRAAIVIGTLAVAALIYAAGGGLLGTSGAGATTVTVSQGLEGASRADVRVSSGVATLHITSGTTSGVLASGSIRPASRERVSDSFSVVGATATLRLLTQQSGPNLVPIVGSGRWELALTEQVPMTLDIATGVGEAVVDLSGVQLDRLTLDTGVGAATLSLPGQRRYDVSVSTGVGAATIRIPQDLAARIVVSRGVGAVSVPNNFSRYGDVYTTADYDTAVNRVDMRLSGGVGAINVELVR